MKRLVSLITCLCMLLTFAVGCSKSGKTTSDVKLTTKAGFPVKSKFYGR